MKAQTAERLYPHPDRPDVLVQPLNGESPDFHRVCHRHEYLSPPVVHLQDAGACPFCLAEYEGAAGKVRYRQLAGSLAGDSER
jgi:hypothetical protein